MTTTHHRTCNLCEAMCGVVIRHDGTQVIDVRGDANDPLSRGHLCPKALGLKDIHEDPDRLKRPLRREGSRFVEIGWDEAFDEVAARLKSVQAQHGRDSVAFYQGNPTVHNHGSMTHGQIFSRALRTRQRYSATSLDQLPHMLAALQMFGHQLLLPVPDLDRTQCFIILGANPMASNGSLMTAPGIKRRIEEIQQRGGKVITIDPRFTETSRIADEHIFIKPGTDAFLLLGLLREMLAATASRPQPLREHLVGWEQLAAIAEPWNSTRVAHLTDVPREKIQVLAALLTSQAPAVLYGRVGVCMQEFGGLATWLLNVVNIASGHFDRPGGMMFTKPAVDVVDLSARAKMAGHFAKRKTRVRGLPEFGGEFPTAALAEEMDTPGPGQVRALVTSAGNPVLSAPNGPRLERALAGLEFMVSVDLYLNETTRHANIILPPTAALEHGHYDLAFHLFTVRNTAKWSEPLFPRESTQRHDWEIFAELAARLRHPKSRLRARVERAAMLALTPDRLIDVALRTGPWGRKTQGLSMRHLKAHPHGVDLGPLLPALPQRLWTSDKKVQLVPDIYRADLARLETHASTQRKDPLVLIGRRELLSNNSWMHNSKRWVKRGTRCTLKMHPDDAQALQLQDKGRVRITSRIGSVEVLLETSSEMKRGVASLPHGWGHHREGARLSVAAQAPGVSLNDLTDEGFVDALSGTIAFSGVPITVVPA